MAVNRMKKVQILTHESHRAALIKHLQDSGVLHITDLTEESPESADSDDSQEVLKSEAHIEWDEKETVEDIIRGMRRDLSELEFAINYLSRFEEKKGFISGLLGDGVIFSPEEYSDVIESLGSPQETCKECRDLEDKAAQLSAQQNRLQTDRAYLIQWINFDLPLEELHDTEKTTIRLGVVPTAVYEDMLAEIESSEVDVFFEDISEDRTNKYLAVIFLKEHEEIAMPILTKYRFSPATLPRTSGIVSDLLNEIDEDMQKVVTEMSEIESRSAELAKNKTNLMALYDHRLSLLEQEDIQNCFLHTAYTFMVEGWVHNRDAETLKNNILERFEEVEVSISEPTEEDEPPVDLENKKLFAPFQMVTNLYGLPQYREIDPTPYIAPFFAFFFGICITDAGYGLVLALVAYLVAKKFIKDEGGGKQLFRVLILSGIATIIVGALMGGWFGIKLEKGPLSFLAKVRVINPNEEMLTFFGVVLALGYLQVWFGFVVKMIIDIKERDWGSFFHRDLSWLIIMTFIIPILIASVFKMIKLPDQLSTGLFALAVICAIWFVILSDREGESIAGRIGTGFFGLYNRIAGSLGDILSYSRLFALGLATGIIANVVNTMAMMTWNAPYFGKVATVGILIGGHIFNLVINALGGFIHTARLQFVEFFTKFYESGGEAFKPFKREHVYTTIMELESYKE